MKKLLTALVVTLGTLAMAEQPPPQRTQTAPGVSSNSVKSSRIYTANGVLKNMEGDNLVLSRPDRKDSSFELRPDTLVTLDNQKVEASALPEGSRISARFQEDGQKLIAVEVDAVTSPGKK